MKVARRPDVGKRGQLIAAKLWDLKMVETGSDWDRKGRDAMMGTRHVQIKSDTRIAESGNLYLEICEKTPGREDQPWRHSPCMADDYIFVTNGWAVLVSWDVLSMAMIGRGLTKISDTSIGILIPFASLTEFDPKQHSWELDGLGEIAA